MFLTKEDSTHTDSKLTRAHLLSSVLERGKNLKKRGRKNVLSFLHSVVETSPLEHKRKPEIWKIYLCISCERIQTFYN